MELPHQIIISASSRYSITHEAASPLCETNDGSNGINLRASSSFLITSLLETYRCYSEGNSSRRRVPIEPEGDPRNNDDEP